MAVTRTYRVSGLTCGACLALVLDAVRSLSDVRSVAVDLVGGGGSRLVITATREHPVETIRAAVEREGFALVEPAEVGFGPGSPRAGPGDAAQTSAVHSPATRLTVPPRLGGTRQETVVLDAMTSGSRVVSRSHHRAGRAGD